MSEEYMIKHCFNGAVIGAQIWKSNLNLHTLWRDSIIHI